MTDFQRNPIGVKKNYFSQQNAHEQGNATDPTLLIRPTFILRLAFCITRVARALASIVVTIIGLLLVTFMIGRVIPVDPVLAVVGDQASPESYAAARAEMGLDQPFLVQVGMYFGKFGRGDLGTSTLTRRPIVEDIALYFPATLELATLATLFGIILGIPAGVYSAARRGRLPDHVIRIISLFGYSMPTFWLGMIGLLVLYAKLGWIAGPGRIDILYDGMVPTVTRLLLVDSLLAGNFRAFASACAHIALPSAILGYFSMAYIARMTRSFMIDQLTQDHIIAARAKGLSEGRVIWRHALGNAAVPLITVVALSYGSLLEGSVLTETVFAWPGLGLYLTNALLSADMNAVLGATVVIGLVFLGLNLVTDAIYSRIDPRAK